MRRAPHQESGSGRADCSIGVQLARSCGARLAWQATSNRSWTRASSDGSLQPLDRPELRGRIEDALARHDRDARERDEAASKVTVEEILDAVGGGSPRRGAAHDPHAGAGEPDNDHVTAGHRDSPRPGTRQLRPAGHRILSLQPAATVVGGIGASTGTDCGLERISGPSVTLDAAVEASGEGQNRLSDRRATQRVFRARVLDFAGTRLGMAAPPGDRATVCRAARLNWFWSGCPVAPCWSIFAWPRVDTGG